MIELCTEEGAAEIARRIEQYWSNWGYRVRCRIEEREYCKEMRKRRWDVRSDMRNGLPLNRQGGAQ